MTTYPSRLGYLDDLLQSDDLPVGIAKAPYASFVRVALPAGSGQVADLPGPAVGNVRVYEAVHFVASVLASPLVNVKVDLVSGVTTYAMQNAQSGGATLNSTLAPHIGFGELFRVTNGGSTAGQVAATYYDVPASQITLVRVLLSTTPATIIPAPSAGYTSRLAQLNTLGGLTRVYGPKIFAYNADSITHSIEVLFGGVVISRSATVTTGLVGLVNSPLDVPVTAASGALTVRLSEAHSTVQPHLFASYETLPM